MNATGGAPADSGRTLAAAALSVAGIAAAVLLAEPLGALRGTMILVLVLPPLAQALDRLGWAELLAARLSRGGPSRVRLIVCYAAWLIVSALLTLDVAAVASMPVGLAVAGRWRTAQRSQFWAAIAGSNVGSMLFPFSNLTNLLLVAGTGVGFTTFVGTAWAPQFAAAAAVGILLALRWRTKPAEDGLAIAAADPAPRSSPLRAPTVTLVAGGVAAVGACAAVVIGVVGGDVALTFAVISGLVVALAVGNGAVGPGSLVRSIPIAGVAVVLFAAATRGPMVDLAGGLPDLERTLPTPVALAGIAVIGGLLASAINNLPAAAFGAVWLVGASPAAIVAYLLGTNVLALLTPYGSLATILGRNLAKPSGASPSTREYLLEAWPFAVVGAAAGLAALIVVR